MLRRDFVRLSGTYRFANLRCGRNPHGMRAHFGVCRLGDVDEIDAIWDPISEQAIKLPDCLIGVEAFFNDLSQRRLEFTSHLDRNAPIGIIKPGADFLVRLGGIADGTSQQSGKAFGYPQQSFIIAVRDIRPTQVFKGFPRADHQQD
jgi:hypothetical protein